MSVFRFVLALGVLSSCTDTVVAADLGKVSRRITKEPLYNTNPKYCLLVFGPETKTIVWLIVDGDVMYVDRNGNGDLTEKGERVQAVGSDLYRKFQAGDISVGPLTHTDLVLYQNPKPDTYQVRVKVAIHGSARRTNKVNRIGHRAGYLRFGERPGNAPIIHFGGPRTMSLLSKPTLVPGQPAELQVGVGTPGLGQGTFAFIEYQGVIPKGVHPLVEILYPSKVSGQQPIKAKFPLTWRC